MNADYDAYSQAEPPLTQFLQDLLMFIASHSHLAKGKDQWLDREDGMMRGNWNNHACATPTDEQKNSEWGEYSRPRQQWNSVQ